MNEYFPGTAVRFTNVASNFAGMLTSIPWTFEVRSQDGSLVIAGTVVQDTDPVSGQPSVGTNYADVLIPLTAPPGVWRQHWQTTGTPIDSNSNAFAPFRVKPLPP